MKRTDRGDEPAAGAATSASVLPVLLAGVLLLRLLTGGHAPHVGDAGVLLGLVLVTALALRQDKERALLAPFATVALIGCLIAASSAISFDPFLSFLIAPAALGSLAALLGVTALGARTAALWSVALAGVLQASVALWQRFVTWPDALARRDELGLSERLIGQLETMRPMGLSVSADLLSAACIAGTGASVALALDRSSRVRPIAALCAAVGIVGVVVSRSAGGALALGTFVVALALLAVLGRVRAFFTVVVLPLSLLVPVVLVAVVGRGAGALKGSAGERLLNWEVGASALLHEPLFGAGWGRFAAAYAAHRTPDANVTRYAHSLPVQVLVEGGLLLGGTLLAVLVLVALLTVRRRAHQSPNPAKNAVVATLLALLLRTLFDYDAQVGQSLALIAVLFGVTWLDGQRNGPVFSAAAAPTTTSVRTRIALLVVVGFGLWGAGAVVVGNARDAVLAPFAQASGPATDDDVAALFRWVDRAPFDSQAAAIAAQLYGRQLSRCAEGCEPLLTQAKAFLVDTTENNEHAAPDALLLRAQIATLEDHDDDAERSIERALAQDPGNRRAHLARVGWARVRGDHRADVWAAQAKAWGVVEPSR